MAELSEQPSNFLYNLSSTFMTFQYILDNYLAWIRMRKNEKYEKMNIWVTKDPEPVVDGDDHEVAVGGHHGAVIQVAAAPVEAVAMNEENNWTRGVLEITWKMTNEG